MKLRRPDFTPPHGWEFHLLTAEGREIVLSEGSEPDLNRTVARQLKALGYEVPSNLKEVIQHQICLRLDDRALCWNSGKGDALHQDWVKPFLKKIADKADGARATKPMGLLAKVAGVVATTVRKISSCGSCGGTIVYDPTKRSNLGRAGKMNQFLK